MYTLKHFGLIEHWMQNQQRQNIKQDRGNDGSSDTFDYNRSTC
jgi:hypothetical protein